MSLSYDPGNCNICHQRNVKVRRLRCGKHNYCRMCVQFVPRLVNGDFSCKTCSDKTKALGTEGLDRVSMYLSTQAGIPYNATDMTVSVDGKKIIAFDEDPSDDNDIDGNNAEWDHLLQAISGSVNNKRSSGVNRYGTTYPRNDSVCARAGSPKSQKIPKKSSYLRLVLPSIDDDYSNASISKQLITNTVTQLLNSQNQVTSCTRGDSRNGSPDSLTSTNSSGFSHEIQNHSVPKHTLLGGFEQDLHELERGTSPCKGVCPRSCVNWTEERCNHIEESPSEIERLLEEIGEIEGPHYPSSGSSSRSCSRSCSNDFRASSAPYKQNSHDHFWD